MEDSSQGFRRRPPPRPASSASSPTRMTPTNSSNSSLQHMPRPQARGTSGPSLLQERLRERKVESARQHNRRSVDMTMERGVQSSPVKAAMAREERRPSSSGIAGKGMGVKQIEEQVSTLHKQNFDLKLELYHRRQRQETLEARLEELERKMEQQAELQELNDQLLAELEKRDHAVEEAVGIIVSLEDKVDKLMQDRAHVREFDEQYASGYFDSSHHDGPPSSPPQFEPTLKPIKSVPRMPSFLSENTEGNEALRSLYLPQNQSYSDATLPQLAEEGSDGLDRMDSPRLSVLSESSFISVYGGKQLALEDAIPDGVRQHRASSSVEKWVDERPVPDITPTRVPSLRNPKNQFLSINDVLESPLQRLEKLRLTLEKTNRGLSTDRALTIQEKRQSKELHRVFIDQGTFDHQHGLPPTPDTISTNTLRHYQNSNDTLSQDRMKQGTFLNSTSTFPVPGATFNAFQSTLSVRPRSAGETVTSRREGHGWDTPSQDDNTDAASLSSNGTYNAPSYQPKRIMTPTLFTYGGNDWGRDMMYNNEPKLPPHRFSRNEQLRRSDVLEHARSDDPPTRRPSRHDELKRSGMADNARSDDTITNGHNQALTRYEEAPQYGTLPLDSAPKPELPDRRSSLSATTKLKKRSPDSHLSPSSNAVTSPASSKESKKSRLPSLRLFGRSETSPLPPPTAPALRPQNASSRTQSYTRDPYGDEEEQARATPPPIKRTRPGQPYRPVSAGDGTNRRPSSMVLESRVSDRYERRGSVNVNPNDTSDANQDDARNGKKWFGLGRSGSLRRN